MGHRAHRERRLPPALALLRRKDTREEAGKALADLKAKGMQINEVTPAEVARMRDKLTRVNAGIAANVGMDLWTETQTALAKLRSGK